MASKDFEVPDPIDFMAKRQGNRFLRDERQGQGRRQPDNERALSWLPLLRELAAGPGSSGVLARFQIDQARALRRRGAAPATVIDLQAADDAIEAMLDVGVRSGEAE